jgi:hypothetical protein
MPIFEMYVSFLNLWHGSQNMKSLQYFLKILFEASHVFEPDVVFSIGKTALADGIKVGLLEKFNSSPFLHLRTLSFLV